jgi:hypothetical protein
MTPALYDGIARFHQDQLGLHAEDSEPWRLHSALLRMIVFINTVDDIERPGVLEVELEDYKYALENPTRSMTS